MRGEFIGVWSETWREIWLPLFDQPIGENGESILEDIFCELYRELAKALQKPTGLAAISLLLSDAISLWEIFDGVVQRAGQNIELEMVKVVYDRSGAENAETTQQRRTLIETALSGLMGQQAISLLEAQLQDYARDVNKIDAAWKREVEKVINNTQASHEAFKKTTAESFAGEWALIGFLESVRGILEGFENPDDDSLTNHYYNLMAAFIDKFSLRYDLRRPCTLCPTLPGIFASLVCDLRTITCNDPHLDGLMKDFEESIRDLRIDCTEHRIKTCIQKQINLLEALARTYPRVRRKTLSAISHQINSWPHEDVRAALQSLYGFTCDYPGIRHAGTAANALRAINMRDLVAMVILLAGFTPYLSNALNPELLYRRA